MGCGSSSSRKFQYFDGDGNVHIFEARDGRLLLLVDGEYPPKVVTTLKVSRTSVNGGARVWEAALGSVPMDKRQLTQVKELAQSVGVNIQEVDELPRHGSPCVGIAPVAGASQKEKAAGLEGGFEGKGGNAKASPVTVRRLNTGNGSLAVGEWVKVWSVSRGRWIYGIIMSEDDNFAVVQYTAPDGPKEKRLPKGHPHLQAVAPGEELNTDWQVMGKYTMKMRDEDVMGEGSSSICRRGYINGTGQIVAIKVYKLTPDFANQDDQDDGAQDNWEAVTMLKYQRQIEVLSDLKRPLEKPSEPNLWCEQLEGVTPESLFMQLIDYSKDKAGHPSKDTDDNLLYVITELAEYSLLDYLSGRKEKNQPLSKENVRSLSRSVVKIVAGLHAKGYVHLDLKPENMMVFNGVLKLIDVDGCIRIGTNVSLLDPSLSCSPVYCAPEWAEFCIDESDDPRLVLRPHLDVWSVGITICELVTLTPVLLNKYTSFYDRSQDIGILFMDWLSKQEEPPCLEAVESFDPQLANFLFNTILICDATARHSLAQAMSHEYLTDEASGAAENCPLNNPGGVGKPCLPKQAPRRRMHGMDRCKKQGTLWKLRLNGDPADALQWTQRDVWIASDGGLYYYSCTDSTPVLIMEFKVIRSAEVSSVSEKGINGYQLQIKYSDPDEPGKVVLRFACSSSEERNAWIKALNEVRGGDDPKRVLVPGMTRIRLMVRNRRVSIKGDAGRASVGAMFKGKLWKLKAGGNRALPDDWYERDMWLAKNGTFCYYSKKEQEELVYYNAEDVKTSVIKVSSAEGCAKHFSFQVYVVGNDCFDVEPGEFAAESKEMRDRWVAEFKKHIKKRMHNRKVVREFMVDDEVKRLGMDFRSSPPDAVYIQHVKPGTWAAKTNIKPGDEIVEVSNVKCSELTQDDFSCMLKIRPLKLGVVLAERRHDQSSAAVLTKEEYLNMYGNLDKWNSAESPMDSKPSRAEFPMIPQKTYDVNRLDVNKKRSTKTGGKLKKAVPAG